MKKSSIIIASKDVTVQKIASNVDWGRWKSTLRDERASSLEFDCNLQRDRTTREPAERKMSVYV